MRIVSWNINSVRLRMQHITDFVNEFKPDILCFQETKVQDFQFPVDKFKELGFEGVYVNGEKSYNGVATLVKKQAESEFKLPLINDDSRHLALKLPGNIELHNFYVPAGGDEPDPEINPKFAHKLDYIDAIKDWFQNNRSSNDKLILTGDLNIAPLEHDVWSSKQLRNVISHTAVERQKLTELLNSMSWIDGPREFVPSSEKLYSWWSYRNRDFRKSNRGRRLDHIWLSPNLKSSLRNYYMYKEARAWQRPSDHIPVIIDLDLAL